MNEVWFIYDQIKELPWYKVLAIAALDDYIALTKIWPAWLLIVVVCSILMIKYGSK